VIQATPAALIARTNNAAPADLVGRHTRIVEILPQRLYWIALAAVMLVVAQSRVRRRAS
jgi:hypothetical protein